MRELENNSANLFLYCENFCGWFVHRGLFQAWMIAIGRPDQPRRRLRWYLQLLVTLQPDGGAYTAYLRVINSHCSESS